MPHPHCQPEPTQRRIAGRYKLRPVWANVTFDVDCTTPTLAVTWAIPAAAGAVNGAAATPTPSAGTTQVGGATPTPVAPTLGGAPAPAPSDDEVTVGGQTDFFRRMTWTGEVPPKLWMNFYTKVLSKHATDSGLKLKVTIETSPSSGISKEKIEETRTALKELGLGGEN